MTDYTFTIHTPENAPEGSRASLEGAPSALASYQGLTAAFGSSSFSQTEQQVALIATSVENDCRYCVAAHTTMSKSARVPEDVLDSLRTGMPIADAKLEALREFTLAVVRKKGWVEATDLEAFTAAGYGQAQVLEVITGVTLKTLTNYVNHIAETPLDAPFQAQAWEPAGV
jgi:AhpD family alkylhydroperoxidase